MSPTITIKHSIRVAVSPETLWDFTQDFNKRHLWDASIIKVEPLTSINGKSVRITFFGRQEATLTYKIEKRPEKTTLEMHDVRSRVIVRGGGHWSYQEQQRDTIWTQVNSIVVKEGWLIRVFMPLIRYVFHQNTKRSMKNAKRIVEAFDQ